MECGRLSRTHSWKCTLYTSEIPANFDRASHSVVKTACVEHRPFPAACPAKKPEKIYSIAPCFFLYVMSSIYFPIQFLFLCASEQNSCLYYPTLLECRSRELDTAANDAWI